MKNEPDIVKKLRNEEETGLLKNNESIVVTNPSEDSSEFFSTAKQEDKDLNLGKDQSKTRFSDQSVDYKGRYKRILDSSPDFIAEVKEDGEFLYANPAMARSIGLTVDELIGKNVFDVLPKEIAQKRYELGKKVLFEGKKQIFEDERNGRFFHNIFIPAVDLNGNKIIQVIGRDITDIKNVENDLKKSMDHFKNLFNCIADPIVIVDSKGKILEMNEKMLESTGYNREDFIGKNVFKTSILPIKTKALLVKNLVKRMAGAEINPYEIKLITNTGEKTYRLNISEVGLTVADAAISTWYFFVK